MRSRLLSLVAAGVLSISMLGACSSGDDVTGRLVTLQFPNGQSTTFHFPCYEDEALWWIADDTLGCVHYEQICQQ